MSSSCWIILKENGTFMANAVLQFTDHQLKQAISQHDLILVDFWAPGCGPCIKLGPVIEQLALLYEGKVFVGKINIDEHAEMAAECVIKTIPTMLIFYKGDEAERLVGNLPITTIQKALNNYL